LKTTAFAQEYGRAFYTLENYGFDLSGGLHNMLRWTELGV